MTISFCEQTAPIWQVIGQVIEVIRIAIPLVIILLGMFDLGKMVLSGDEKTVKATQKLFIKRLIYGVAIFFVATIVQFVFGLVGDDVKHGESKICYSCVSKPKGEECLKFVEKNNLSAVEDDEEENDNNDNQNDNESSTEEDNQTDENTNYEENNDDNFEENNNNDENIDTESDSY